MEDLRLWRGFRRAAEVVSLAVERELVNATGLSGADHGVLTRLAEADRKIVRQQELCDAMRWDRTRMSHQLTRMETRGLVKRSKLSTGGVGVQITASGNRARREAQPVHAEALRKHFFSRLTTTQRQVLASISASFSSGDAAEG